MSTRRLCTMTSIHLETKHIGFIRPAHASPTVLCYILAMAHDLCGFRDTHKFISTLKERTPSLFDQLSYEIASIELRNLISHPKTKKINSKHNHNHIIHATKQRKHINSTQNSAPLTMKTPNYNKNTQTHENESPKCKIPRGKLVIIDLTTWSHWVQLVQRVSKSFMPLLHTCCKKNKRATHLISRAP